MHRALVDRAKQGDSEAFDALARAVGDRCMAIACRILRDADLAEDAVQAALITAWRELRTLRDPDRFEPWLHRILTHECYAEARRRSRRSADDPGPADRRARPTPAGILTVDDRDQLERALPEADPRAARHPRLPSLPRAATARGRRPTRHPARDREVPTPLRDDACERASRPTHGRRSLSQERPA